MLFLSHFHSKKKGTKIATVWVLIKKTNKGKLQKRLEIVIL